MSNDNNQNENIKNDKFSLYTEKINPKKPKKKNKKLIALGNTYWSRCCGGIYCAVYCGQG